MKTRNRPLFARGRCLPTMDMMISELSEPIAPISAQVTREMSGYHAALAVTVLSVQEVDARAVRTCRLSLFRFSL